MLGTTVFLSCIAAMCQLSLLGVILLRCRGQWKCLYFLYCIIYQLAPQHTNLVLKLSSTFDVTVFKMSAMSFKLVIFLKPSETRHFQLTCARREVKISSYKNLWLMWNKIILQENEFYVTWILRKKTRKLKDKPRGAAYMYCRATYNCSPGHH